MRFHSNDETFSNARSFFYAFKTFAFSLLLLLLLLLLPDGTEAALWLLRN